MEKNEAPKIVTKKHLARLERERIQNRRIMIASIAIIIIVIGVIGYGILDQMVLRGMKPVGTVNGDKITTSEFDKYSRFYRYQLIQQYNQTYNMAQMFGSDETYASYFQNSLTQIQSTLDTPATIGDTVLNQLIEDRLIRQEAARLGITVTKEEVDVALQEAFGFYANGTPTPQATATTFFTPTISDKQAALIASLTPTAGGELTTEPTQTSTSAPTEIPEPTATSTSGPTATEEPTSTPYTLDGYSKEFNEYVTTLKEDTKLDGNDLHKIYEINLYREKIMEAITADLRPVQDQVWARHILVDTIEEAQKVIERINNGENWIAVAQEVSKDTGSKDAGGDLGWFGTGQMVAEFESAAFSLGVGETSEPVKSTYGFHIIQVLGHEERPLDNSTFEELKSTTFTKWLTEQQEAATITKIDDYASLVPSEPDLFTVLSKQQ